METVTPLTATKTRWQRLALACLALVVLLNLAAFAVRAAFVAWAGPYAATTGFEELNLYHVWKVVHGHPLYEWPQKEHYAFTHYNPAFYHVYAAWAKLWGADGADLVNKARALTPLFALLGLVVQAHLIRRLAPGARGQSPWVWGLSFLTWFGPVFGGWWVVTVRPDIAAVALALSGFALALRGQETGGLRWWLGASLLFFAAWSFKQTVVWIYAGTVGQALLARVRWSRLAALILPFAVLAAGVIAGGGEIYRYSLFVAPRVYQWFVGRGLAMLAPAVALNLFFWAFGGWALWRARAWTRAPRTDSATSRLRATAIASVPPLAMGAVQVSAQGSNFNNLLEGFVLVCVLASAAWLRLWTSAPGQRSLAVGALLLASMAPVPAAHLVLAARGATHVEISGMSLGNVIKLNAEQLAKRRRMAEWMRTLPQPVWPRDRMLALPWFATGNRYPAILRDYEFEIAATRAGTLEGRGVNDWIRRGAFGTVLLNPSELGPRSVAHAAGYREVAAPENFAPFPNEFGVDLEAPVALTRGAPAR